MFNIFDELGIQVAISNPQWVKAAKDNKDDTGDFKWISDIFRLSFVTRISFIPSNDICILREFIQYQYKLLSIKNSEKSFFQNAFTICNLELDSVVSAMFAKYATAIIDYRISEDPTNWTIALFFNAFRKTSPIRA